MLKLDRLVLSGFKSFVDPVEVRFAGGVTGIVGPNGCGKSNLSDAITWVLGEQSAKSMRGDTMEDVIFNGSEKRKPLGMGEVTLTFVGPPGFAGSDDGKVTLSRRVFRSGESQYRLNGKVVRLKDVKDLLMDTGLGVRAYSVIEQGKIGMILSGRPQERRRLIEEAAGITRYKARKKIAEVKLEEATANLLRLDDIISEVERNLRSLKRQAGAARRFQERQATLKELERTVLLGRWANLAGELSSNRIALGEAQSAESDLAAEVHRGEATLARLRGAVDARADELAGKARRQAELAATIEGRQQFLSGARRTIGEIDSRRATGESTAARLGEEIEGHSRALAELAERRGGLTGEHDEAAAAVAADGEALRRAERAAAEVEARLEELRRDLLASLAELNELRARSHRQQIESEKSSYRDRHLVEELEQKTHERIELDHEMATVETRLEELSALVADEASEVERLRAGQQSLLDRERSTNEQLRALETAHTSTSERQRLLADLAAEEADQGRAWEERLAEAGVADAQRLRQRVRALAGWERSLDHFLGALLDAILVPTGVAPLELAARLAAGGRAAGVLLVPRPSSAAGGRVDDPAVLAPLGEALGLASDVAAALPPAYLVESAADAERLAARHPGVAFLARQHLWARDGQLWLEGEEVQPGYLERTRELDELAARLPALETDIAAARDQLATLVRERSTTAEQLRGSETRLGALRQEDAVLRSRHDQLSSRRNRAAEGEANLRREHQALAGQLELLATTRDETAAEISRLDGIHGERESRFDAVQKEAEEVRRERESLRALGAGRRGQLDVLTERLCALEQQSARLERERDAARRDLASWEEEKRGLGERRGELETGMERAELELQEALELRARGEEILRAEQEELESEKQRVREADTGVAEARQRHDAARARVEEQRVTLAGLEHDSGHLANELRVRCAQAPPEVAGEPPANLAELEVDYERLREQVESFGPVNVLAAEEYGAEEERHAFLTTQRADVANSVESLRQTIREINVTSSERFRETFTAVNEQFSKTFVELFRGGEAEMRLMDEEDILECGIEIVARPPGKRLQNLMLLSGGEKALTAIALLFALFRIKPSPFCILDEVDAPLDDVNTLRYVGMLRQLAKETQCIVITHNKLTMEVASTLYGVTMEERGVSKLIQVELEEVHPAAQTA